MQIYEVGGVVRDRLLGRRGSDRDYVVVGATPEQMLAQGFRPVGKDFPVFLHPDSHEEYALARTERKTAAGYHGFSFHAAPDVTLEEDLLRRDLTINAMACLPDQPDQIIDPFGGQQDLAARLFRHVSPAFCEDPVRILRIARFAARFPEFTVAPETLALMQAMVSNGEVDALVAERVWAELAKGLQETAPQRMIEVLRDCGALAKILPEVDALFGVPQPLDHHPEGDCGTHVLLTLARSAALQLPLAGRFAALVHDLGKGTTPQHEWPHHPRHEERGVPAVLAVCERLRVPVECRELAVLVCREHGAIHAAKHPQAESLLGLLERCDALRRPERFQLAIDVTQADSQGRPGYEQRPFPAREVLLQALQITQQVPAGEIARQCADKRQIPETIRQARLTALTRELHLTSA